MFEKFGEYMFFLLYAPLKRVKKTVNQFYIFFKVVGKLFDQCKAYLFRLRKESSVLTCSDVMLPVHGQDRDMARLAGETLENYRVRLSMKGIIAEMAGINEGIRYLAKAFGYENVEIEPSPVPGHWAEASVYFVGGNIVIDDRELLLQELNKIKPARTLLSLRKEQRYHSGLYVGSVYIIGKQITIRQG